MLPILLGNATKMTTLLSKAGKEYVGVLYLHGEIGNKALASALREFSGRIYQRPPLKSTVSRRLRVRTVYGIELIERKGRFALLRATLEAGTYVRKLFYDIGEFLGAGASMRELRRTWVGPLVEKDSVTLQQLREAYLHWVDERSDEALRRTVVPVEGVLRSLVPRIIVKDTAVSAIAHGASVKAPGVSAITPIFEEGEVVGIFTLKGEIVALAKARASAKDLLEMERGVVAEPSRVIMERDLYPPSWRKGA